MKTIHFRLVHNGQVIGEADVTTEVGDEFAVNVETNGMVFGTLQMRAEVVPWQPPVVEKPKRTLTLVP